MLCFYAGFMAGGSRTEREKKMSKTSEKISSGNPQFNVMAHVGGWPTLHGSFFFVFFFKKNFISPSLFIVHCPLLSSF